MSETKRTNKQLLDADPIKDELTMEEMQRREVLLRNIELQLNSQDLKDRVDDRKNKKAQIEDRYKSRGHELRKMAADGKKHQDGCSHRKRGRGVEGLQRGGDAPEFAVIRHLLPWNEWYQRCQRCGKTWKPPHLEDYPDNAEGKAAFEQDKTDYKLALAWPTDNTPSTGITFSWDDGGKFAHETVKNTDLR